MVEDLKALYARQEKRRVARKEEERLNRQRRRRGDREAAGAAETAAERERRQRVQARDAAKAEEVERLRAAIMVDAEGAEEEDVEEEQERGEEEEKEEKTGGQPTGVASGLARLREMQRMVVGGGAGGSASGGTSTTQASLELDPTRYPPKGLISPSQGLPYQSATAEDELVTRLPWLTPQPPDETDAFVRTLVLKVESPKEPDTRWSFNLCPYGDHEDNIFLHFNPRNNSARQEIVECDKVDTAWGWVLSRPLRLLPELFGRPVEIVTQILPHGFMIFVGRSFASFVAHRRPPGKEGDDLALLIPIVDGYGQRDRVTVHKIWWGLKLPMARLTEHALLSRGIDIELLTTLLVWGLPAESNPAAREILKRDVIQAFEHFNFEVNFVNIYPNGTGKVTLKPSTAMSRLNQALIAVHAVNGYEYTNFTLHVSHLQYDKRRLRGV